VKTVLADGAADGHAHEVSDGAGNLSGVALGIGGTGQEQPGEQEKIWRGMGTHRDFQECYWRASIKNMASAAGARQKQSAFRDSL
jgi:hypothetical protein